MTEGKRMGRNVDFGNDLDKTFCGFLLKMDEFFFSIVTIAGCQSGICFTLQSVGCIGLIPIVIVIGFETVVVQYHLHEVHFVI